MKNIAQWINKNSVNIAGGVSLFGSFLVILNADMHSAFAKACFFVAELLLLFYGHKTWGYSAGCTFFCVGDIALAFSPAVEGNLSLQIGLLAMALAWGLGACRYPVETLSSRLTGRISVQLQNIADTIPAITGSANLFLRLPSLLTAFIGGNIIVGFAITCWGIADILAGRLQNYVSAALKYKKHLFITGF